MFTQLSSLTDLNLIHSPHPPAPLGATTGAWDIIVKDPGRENNRYQETPENNSLNPCTIGLIGKSPYGHGRYNLVQEAFLG
jgi:hypothetical protein